jgi:hypothetical protein
MELELLIVVQGDAAPRATTPGFLWRTLVRMQCRSVRLDLVQTRQTDYLIGRSVLDRDAGYLARE